MSEPGAADAPSRRPLPPVVAGLWDGALVRDGDGASAAVRVSLALLPPRGGGAPSAVGGVAGAAGGVLRGSYSAADRSVALESYAHDAPAVKTVYAGRLRRAADGAIRTYDNAPPTAPKHPPTHPSS